MSDNNEADLTPSSKYTQIPTESLKEMLRYSVFSDDALDADVTRGILAELQRRDPKIPHKSPEEAWAIFNSEYSGNDSAYLHCAYEGNNQTGDLSTGHKGVRRFRALVRTATAAAIIVAVLLTGTITAYALGFDLWGVIAQWSQETFAFRAKETMEPFDEAKKSGIGLSITEQYGDLQTALTRHGINEQVAPTWLPDGYELVELKITAETSYQLFFSALYMHGDKSIGISIALLYSEPVTDYEKDNGEVMVYEKGGITHYIMTNNDQCRVVWMNRNLECSISGDLTKDESTQIVDSIYER